MTALPLLLALAVTAEPAAAPAAPVAAPAAAAEEAEGPGVIVAPETAPAAAPAAPAAPFVVDGFLDRTRVATGAVLHGGYASTGLATGLDATVRWHGVILGGTIGFTGQPGTSNGTSGLRTLGFLGGYGLQRGHYRGQAVFGWGVSDERVRTDAGVFAQPGHFKLVQAGVDRAVWGGEGWRGSLGVGAWWRGLTANSNSTLAKLGDEYGVTVRLGGEVGW